MALVQASWSQLPAQGDVVEVCQNLPGDRLASSSVDGAVSYVQIWERDCSSGDWDLVSQVVTPAPVSHLAWSHPEFGCLLAGGTSAGSVLVWEAPRPPGASASAAAGADADEEMQEMREWSQAAEVQCSKHAVRHISFGPRQLGLNIAVASQDGSVHVLEADRVLAPSSWTLQSKFNVGHGARASADCECTGLSWRAFSPGVAPLVAVSLKGSVEVWQYMRAVMTWQHVASLPISQPGVSMSSVHWAPTLGRPCDLIAAAHGSTVDIFSLTGDTSALQVELLASVEHSAAVWKVEFNMLGTCLAAATENNLVHLWKPDFVGKWLLVSVICGSPDAAE